MKNECPIQFFKKENEQKLIKFLKCWIKIVKKGLVENFQKKKMMIEKSIVLKNDPKKSKQYIYIRGSLQKKNGPFNERFWNSVKKKKKRFWIVLMKLWKNDST